MKRHLWILSAIAVWAGAGFVVNGLWQNRCHGVEAASARPVRVAALAPNLTEILFALGLEDETAAVTLYSDYPPAADKKAKIGTFWQPNIEAVIAVRPDLVVTLAIAQQRAVADRLRRMGYNCLTVEVNKVNELFEAIEKIGDATGRKEQAEELLQNMKERLFGLSSRLGAGPRPRVLWVVQREPLRVAGRDTFINEMIELAGGENAIGPTIHKYPPIGAEQVIASAPEVIIEPTMYEQYPAGQQDNAVAYWSRFANVPAVADERIYVIRGETVSRLGPRLCEAAETVARCLRPELFAD